MKWLKESTDSTEVLLSDEYAKSIDKPVKVFTAGDDTIVDSSATSQFCNNLAQCSETHFAKSKHCINREDYQVYDQILQESIELFDQYAY